MRSETWYERQLRWWCSRVAQADQLAATEQAGVILKTFCPPTHLYVLDFDQLCALPEDFRVRL